MNDIDDIEKLLQQYGSDMRQQQQAADRLRQMARRQARRRTAVACVAAVLLVAGGYRLQQSKAPMMAENAAAPAKEQGTATTVAEQALAHQARATVEPLLAPPRHTAQGPAAFMPDAAQPSSPLQAYADDYPLPSLSVSDTMPVPQDAEPAIQPRQELQAANTLPALLAESADEPVADLSPSLAQTARWHFTAAVGTAMMGGMASYEDMTLASMDALSLTNEPFSMAYATPNSHLQAKVGVSYALWEDARQRFSVGLVADGYAQQTDVHFQSVDYCMAMNSHSFDASDQGLVQNVNTTDEIYSKNIMSLFVGVPLSYDFYPRGTGRLGCQLSLTPAHSLVATPSKRIFINPWKLTIGAGVLFPKGWIDHISLTANLLPLYQNNPIHEFGVLIGF